MAADGATPDTGNGTPDFYAMDGVDRNLSTGGVTLSEHMRPRRTTSMPWNADGTWVNYDSATQHGDDYQHRGLYKCMQARIERDRCV